jgi:UDP-sugar diphosphatase
MSNDSLLDSKFDDFELSRPTSSVYIKPYRLKFKQNDHPRIWDGIASHSSVSCVIYDSDKQCIILVRQFRPVVFVSKIIEMQENLDFEFNQNLEWSKVLPKDAFTYELCAGICDKKKTEEETIKEEILEECGYTVSLENIHKISSCRSGVGLLGSLHTIFYTEVNEKMKTHNGGGNHHEGISLVKYYSNF